MTETPAVPETPTNPTKPTMEEGAATANAASVASEGPATLDVKKEEAPADAAPVKAEPPTAEDLARIKQLLEFYFGESNYRRDKFLQKEAADGKDGACLGYYFVQFSHGRDAGVDWLLSNTPSLHTHLHRLHQDHGAPDV